MLDVLDEPRASALPTFYEPQAAWGGEYDKAEFAFEQSNYVAQEKLDGARYVIHKDLDGEVRIYSRVVSKKTGYPTIKTEQLIHIATEFDNLFPPGSVIDGEVVAPVLNSSSNLVTKATGASPEKSWDYQNENGFVRYAAFDCLAYGGVDLTARALIDRLAFLDVLLKQEPGSMIWLCSYIPGEEFKRKLYDRIVKRGGEGIILKDLFAPYLQGKRTKNWVKVKKERTFDVVFMGITEAEAVTYKVGSGEASPAKYAGQAGAIRFGQFLTETTGIFADIPVLTEIGQTSGFDDALRLDITANAEVYTQQQRVFEVRAQEQFESGALRHPRFVQWRDDKVAADCVLRIGES